MTLILKASGYREGRWRNGLGVSWEIASEGGDDFSWRLALAKLDAGVPFSAYPGIDRVFTIIEGSGINLDIEGLGHVEALPLHPVRFPGDRPTFSHLVAGPCRALNLFTRRGALSSEVSVTRHDKGDELLLPPRCLLYVIAGLASIDDGEINAGDTLISDGAAMVRCQFASTLWRASLSAVNTM